MQRRACEAMRGAARVLDEIVAIHLRAYPADVGREPFAAFGAQNVREAIALGGGRLTEQPNQHKRALAFPKIAVALLAITLIGHQVEQIVLNLEGRAKEISEPH